MRHFFITKLEFVKYIINIQNANSFNTDVLRITFAHLRKLTRMRKF